MQGPSKLFHSIIIIGAAMGAGCAAAEPTSTDAQTEDASSTDAESSPSLVGDVSVGEIDSSYDGAPMPWW